MAKKAVWGIDVGEFSIKAVRAIARENGIQVLTFDQVQYDMSLSEAGDRADELVREALGTFLRRNDLRNSEIYCSMAGHSALVRFIKLPPVEKKKIPEIVKYEAHQQIPFPLDEVVWDYQAIDRGYIPGEQVEVGIFAQRRELIHSYLSNLLFAGIGIDVLQLAPLALYNFVAVDNPPEAGARIVLDVGADNTSLLIISGDTIWFRNLPIAGNDLTRYIQRAFNISREKAEKLKIAADKSKYVQKIYEAMRPALRALVDEVQRSLGFYKSVHPDVRFEEVLCFGSTFRLEGVERFLAANLNYKIERFTQPRSLDIESALRKEVFDHSPESFGVAFGLVMQALADVPVASNLLPSEIQRERIIMRKRPYAIAAVAIFAATIGLAYVREKSLSRQLEKNRPGGEVTSRLDELEKWSRELKKAREEARKAEAEALRLINVAKNRTAWLYIFEKIGNIVASQPPGAIVIKSIDSSEGGPSEKAETWAVPGAPAFPGTPGMPGRRPPSRPSRPQEKGEKPKLLVKIVAETKVKAPTFSDYVTKVVLNPLKEDEYFEDVKLLGTKQVRYLEEGGKRVAMAGSVARGREGITAYPGAPTVPGAAPGAPPGFYGAPTAPGRQEGLPEVDLRRAKEVTWFEFQFRFYVDPEAPVPPLKGFLGRVAPEPAEAEEVSEEVEVPESPASPSKEETRSVPSED